MKKALLLIIVVSFALALFSCSEESSTPSIEHKVYYMPTTVGSYWKYKSFILDKDYIYYNEDNPYLDSMVIMEKKEKLDKMSYLFNTYRYVDNNYVFYQDAYYYTDDNNIYANSDLMNNYLSFNKLPLPLPITIESKWILLIAPEKNSWEQELQKFDKVPFTFEYNGNPITAELTGDIQLKGEKGDKDTLILDGKIFATQRFINKITFNANVTLYGTTMNEEFTRSITYWCAEGIGIVKMTIDPLYKIITLPMVKYTVNLEGTESYVYDYYIAK